MSSSVLGSGKYGYVRECKDVSGIMYAIKTIDKSRAPRLDHIKREVELLRVVDHPNIMKMIDSFEDEHYTYIVTEMYTGGDLFDLVVNNITDHGCLRESQAMMITKALLKSVHYLHSKDIVHRDIKPENLLFSPTKKGAIIKLIDFGLSRRHGVNDGNMTNPVGTPYYMSPEILRGSYDRSCDLWAVGVVCYILLSGYPPFNGYNDNEILASTLNGNVIFEKEVWGNLSKLSRDFVTKMLYKNKSKRMTSANEALKHQWINE